MRKSILISTTILLIIFAFSLNWVISDSSESERERRSKVDTRIDNQAYWVKMAEKGYIPFNPDVKTEPAIYRGTKIKAFSVRTEDSPDVPVTEINSTQSENSIFVDPQNNEIVLNSNNSTENPLGDLYGANDLYSFDAGETWEGEVLGAGGENSGDPTTAIGLNGRWHVNYISSSGGMGASFSDDQGETWTARTVAPNPGSLADKNHMWIDNSPDSPYEGNLYVVWTNFGGSDDSEIAFSYSTDDGETWQGNFEISSEVNAGSHNQGVNVSTGPNGEVYAIWAIYDSWPSDESAIGMAVSYDGGATFDPAVRIIDNIRGIRTTETSKNQRVNSFPVAAVDCSNGPDKGAIYVTWSNIGTPGINTGNDMDVYVIKSSDEGATWTDPVRVNQDPAGEGKEHYFPWICVDASNGVVSLIYYDDRNVTSTQCEVYCANSEDGGETWEDFLVSDVAFTPSPIPGLASGYMGDYLGIHSLDGWVYPVWCDNRLGHVMTFVSPYETNPLNKPSGLSGEITFETGVTDLTWNYEEMEDFLYFNIYRDGELLGTTTDTSYSDNLPDYGMYNYKVTAFYTGGFESGAVSINLQWGDAHISVDPLSIYERLTVDSMSTKYIKVLNTGQLDLIYDISTFVLQKNRSIDEYCNASGGGYEHISKVEFGDIYNESDYDEPGYSDFTNLSTVIQIGESYTITVTNGFAFDLDQCGAWIDWDQNEIFDEEMIEFQGSPGEGPYTASVTVPLGAETGSTRLRIRIMYTGDLDPCGSTQYGEVEDYTVNVRSWLDIDPTVGTISPGDSSMIAIDFDATDYEIGMYYATTTFFSNDPDIDQVDVDLTLEISEALVAASAANNQDNICFGTGTQLIATPHGATGTPTYEWTSDPEGFESSEQSPMVYPEVTTWYFVTMTDNRATTLSDSILITVRPLPEVELGADTTICGNWQIELDAGDQGHVYEWSTGEETRTIIVDSTTMFDGYGERNLTVTVYGTNKCVNSDTVTVDVMNCTGIGEFSDNVSLSIYPNPNSGLFNINLISKDKEELDIIVTNQLGAVIFSKENVSIDGQKMFKIDLGQSAAGVYQVFVKGKNNLFNKKIVVK